MLHAAKDRPATGKHKLAAFDASCEKDVAKREKIKAYNALLLKLAAADDPRNAPLATPLRCSKDSKDTARSKQDSSGKKTAVKVHLATKATPGKNGPQPPTTAKLSAASTQDELAKTAPPPADKSPLRFNNVQLIEAKKPLPNPPQPQPQKKVVLRESTTRIPLKTPPPKKASPQKPVPKAAVKPPVPTLAQLRSQTPTPSASMRRVQPPPAAKSPPPRPQQQQHQQQHGAPGTPASAYRTPVKPAREAPKQQQSAVKAASLTLRLSGLLSKSRITQTSFALHRLKLETQHCKIKEAFAEEFRDYSLKKRLFRACLCALAEAKKR